MIEMLSSWVLRCPACAGFMGKVALSLGGFMLLTGLRFERLLDRIASAFGRAGSTSPENLREGWPWWVNVMIPEGAIGFSLAILLVVAGGGLLMAARWARKFQ